MRKHFEASLAGALILWLLYSCLAAANPSLHHALHEDAGHGSHHCAITLIEKHQLLAADSLGENVKLSFDFDHNLPLPASIILTCRDCPLVPGRAPPV